MRVARIQRPSRRRNKGRIRVLERQVGRRRRSQEQPLQLPHHHRGRPRGQRPRRGLLFGQSRREGALLGLRGLHHHERGHEGLHREAAGPHLERVPGPENRAHRVHAAGEQRVGAGFPLSDLVDAPGSTREFGLRHRLLLRQQRRELQTQNRGILSNPDADGFDRGLSVPGFGVHDQKDQLGVVSASPSDGFGRGRWIANSDFFVFPICI